MTYELIEPACDSGVKSIRCLICGSLSSHPTDVLQRYCARCVRFHEVEMLLARTALTTGINHARPDLVPTAQCELLSRMLDLLKPETSPSRSPC